MSVRFKLVLLLAMIVYLSGYCFAEVAPLKGKIVFSALVSEEEYTSQRGRYDLFIQDVPSNKTTRLTDHRANPELKLGGAIREPIFSFDGKEILFLADDISSCENLRMTVTDAAPYPNTLLNVWRMVISSGSVVQLTEGEIGWYDASWSPQSDWFSAVYPSRSGVIDQDKPIPDDIYAGRSSGTKVKRVARTKGSVSDIFWSSDGKNILFQLNKDFSYLVDPNLYAVSRDGGKVKTLIKGKGERYGYSFSPDGGSAAYIQDGQIYISKADGSNQTLVLKKEDTQNRAWFGRPKWSKAGDRLAIPEAIRDGKSENFQITIHIYDIASRKDKVITGIQQRVTQATWSNNGEWLILNIYETGNREGLIAVSVADGRVVTLKEPNERTNGLDWFEVVQ